MFITIHLNSAVKYLAKGLFPVLAAFLFFPSLVLSAGITGCSSSTHTTYENGFQTNDFVLEKTSVDANGRIILDTGAQAIDPNRIVIPFTQEVSVTFLYEGAGYVSDFGWMLYDDVKEYVDVNGIFQWVNVPDAKKHMIFSQIRDDYETRATSDCCGGGDGILDTDYGGGGFPTTDENALKEWYDHTTNKCLDGSDYKFIVDGDGVVTPKDMKKSIGTITGGTEIVFFLTADKRWTTKDNNSVFFTKTNWNPDVYNACTPAGYVAGTYFNKIYELGTKNTTDGTCVPGTSGWLAEVTKTRLFDSFGISLSGNYTLRSNDWPAITGIKKGGKYSHAIVGAPANDANQWILGMEDLNSSLYTSDVDVNDMVFRIERQTGGTASLKTANAVTVGTNDYYTAVNFEVYDNMPGGYCAAGSTSIIYYVSIDNGAHWESLSIRKDWDVVKEPPGTGYTKLSDVSSTWTNVANWTFGSPPLTYRSKRIDFSGLGKVGRQLLWKAELISSNESCVPVIFDVKINGTVASNGFFSRASPSVQTNMLYSGSYETPASNWTDKKVLHGHLYATRLYNPADPSVSAPIPAPGWGTKGDAGEVLTAMSPAARKIYYPSTVHIVKDEKIGQGGSNKKTFAGNFTGNLGNPISAGTVKITDSKETFTDSLPNVLTGNFGGTGTINLSTGAFNLTFKTAPGNKVPILASYIYYTTTPTLNEFTTDTIPDINTTLGLDDTYIVPSGFKHDFNGDKLFNANDGACLVNWIRGYNTNGTKKEWLLGPIDHSVPAIQTPPGVPAWYYGTAVTQAERDKFDLFVKTWWQRPTLVYVGARDGMLHAFDGGDFRLGYYNANNIFIWGDNPATTTITENRGYFKNANYGTGSEIWAFIPANLVSRLKNNLMSGTDQAYVDASPTISDVYINNEWKTVLLSAEGNGGDTVFCLDVTDTSKPPVLLWEFADPSLFRSRSSPSVSIIGRTIVNGTKKWVAFFVSGKTYDNTQYPSIYMIDIATGSELMRIFLDSEPSGAPVGSGKGGVPSGQPAVVDSDGNGYIDRIYIGTDKGYLYKVSIPDNPDGSSAYGIANCVINTDFSYTDSLKVGHEVSSNQKYHPIYASPAVVVDNTFSSSGDIKYNIKILFGTGDNPYYDESIDDATRYHFFAYRDESPKTVCNTNSVSLDWYYELAKGERIFASAFAAAGSIYFGTSTSGTEDPCAGAESAATNSGKLYSRNLTTGESIATIATGNILSAPVVDDEHLYVNIAGQRLPRATTGIYNNQIAMGGLVKTNVTTWREIFKQNESLSPIPTTTPSN